MPYRVNLAGLAALTIAWFLTTACAAAETAPDYSTEIAPILKKYCAGCHNDEDVEGELSLESFAAIGRGGEHGPALQPGDAQASRMIRVLTGKAKPAMPPKDEPRPGAKQIALLAAWIDGGAKGPDGQQPDRTLLVPKLKRSAAKPPVTALAYSPDGKLLAVAKFRTVEIMAADTKKVIHTLSEHPGKINDLRFTTDGSRLIVAGGVTGLYGQAQIWDVSSGKSVKTLRGHRDALYVALPSPDGKILATAGYDRRIILWDLKTDKPLHVLSEHNGAVYDLAFTPDGKILASASEDTTIKIWHVASGRRLDTRGEPLKEQYSVAISPDGRFVAAGGADNRVRLWRLVSHDRPRINPLLHARYAHEGAITRLRFSGHLAVWPSSGQIAGGRMDGSLERYRLAPLADSKVSPPVDQPTPRAAGSQDVQLTKSTEREPNDTAEQATTLKAPAQVTGVIAAAKKNGRADVDLFRFASQAGEKWILEINAARSKSPLDSKIEVLDAGGKPVPRVVLQAVRDSYFTFRGKDSNTSGDFRLHNWREMSLNQYLYAGGEVVRLYHYPRGPDSGFNVYPNSGKRHGYFGTTPLSHALGAPCYIVEPHPPGETIVPNGLPVFRLNYENDDDSLRKLGAETILGGEFEAGLLALVERLQTTNQQTAGLPQHEPVISTARQRFRVPDRSGLPALRDYAKLDWGNGEQRVVGYTEASRGCKHLCRHCPVVPVYQGRFRVVQREVVLEDIRRQVAAGASHITFGDPDFLNGPGHARAVVEALHREFPTLTYDVTVKVEHLLKHAEMLAVLRDTGCLFVISAFESFDDRVLALLEKGHTRADASAAVEHCRNEGLVLVPTFVTFTPWLTLEAYEDLLETIARLGLVETVAPVQLAIRLLIPDGSRLLELAAVRGMVEPFDEERLCHPWRHPDPRVDALQRDVEDIVATAAEADPSRAAVFIQVWERLQAAFERPARPLPEIALGIGAVPQFSEPWYCCAEPTPRQEHAF
ncbi:MAG: radical SAM protein [Planctomycetes bacterium]|nr:radical SAM protein [Planctomycetota bacterium]